MEWTTKNKRATLGSTLRPFQSVELSLHWLLPSRANVRFIRPDQDIKDTIKYLLTQFIEQSLNHQYNVTSHHYIVVNHCHTVVSHKHSILSD